MGVLVDRKHRELLTEEIQRISGTYHAWRGEEEGAEYTEVPGFSKACRSRKSQHTGLFCRRRVSLELPILMRKTSRFQTRYIASLKSCVACKPKELSLTLPLRKISKGSAMTARSASPKASQILEEAGLSGLPRASRGRFVRGTRTVVDSDPVGGSLI